jgi:hypothetical protein
LGLSVPRFLLRLPYGDNTQTIDKFSFEEMPGTPDRRHYLWGNPALACATLLAQTFQKDGWAGNPGTVLALEDLPIHVYTVDDEQEVTLGEAWLVRPQTEQLVLQGIMPILCVKGKGAMQLLRFCALAEVPPGEPPRDLHGRWSQTDLMPVRRASAPAAKVSMVATAPTEYQLERAAADRPAPPAKAPPPKPRQAPVPTGARPPAAKPAAAAPARPAAPAPPRPAAPAPKPAAPAGRPAAPAAPAASAAPPKPAAPPPEAEAPPPEEEELDPELAALLKQLE